MGIRTIARVLKSTLLLASGCWTSAIAQEYSTCKSWQNVVDGEQHRYAPVIRVSEPGTKDQPAYTGFWFYDGLQFDESGRYALAMKVDFQDRDVTSSDRGEIGYLDLEDRNRWTKIGETTAWNWQQGCRLTWRGRSHEILWNDRADDASHFVCRVYDFKTGARRTLPRPIYDVSRDGTFALTHDFQRMRHGKSTHYVGIPDRYEGHIAPAEIGVEKMDLNTGRVEFLISLRRLAGIAFPQRTVSIDASHEGLGRQMYIVPIGHILDHPPRVDGGNP